jgi:molecular chaperone DnaJ
MPKNYYVILGIPANSTQTDIKAAYRRLAKEFHPDYYGKNPGPFQVIHEAYSILSDPKSRRSYDDSIQYSPRSHQPQHVDPVWRYERQTVEPLIPDEEMTFLDRMSPQKSFHHFWSAFDSMFDDQYFGTFKERLQQEHTPFQGITIEITLSPAQAQRGGNVRLNVPFQMRCPSCSRYGVSRYYNCWRCNGTGVISGEKTVMLSYPAGITENHTIQFTQSPSGTGKMNITAVFKIRSN